MNPRSGKDVLIACGGCLEQRESWEQRAERGNYVLRALALRMRYALGVNPIWRRKTLVK